MYVHRMAHYFLMATDHSLNPMIFIPLQIQNPVKSMETLYTFMAYLYESE